MSSPANGTDGSWFDLARLKQLVRLMRDHDLSEVDLQLGEGHRVRLRKGFAPAVSGMVAPSIVAAAPTSTLPAEVSPSTDSARAAASKLVDIKSPIVGTFYTASSPDVEPFAKVGTAVSADSTVCIVEAMKVFNEIPAGVSGVIREILVENGSPVEYGQPLFRVDPS